MASGAACLGAGIDGKTAEFVPAEGVEFVEKETLHTLCIDQQARRIPPEARHPFRRPKGPTGRKKWEANGQT